MTACCTVLEVGGDLTASCTVLEMGGDLTACCTVLEMSLGVERVVLHSAVAAVLGGDLTVAAGIQMSM